MADPELSAHEREVEKALDFVHKNPEFEDLLDPPVGETGEIAKGPQQSTWLGTTRGKLLAFGTTGEMEELEYIEHGNIRPITDPKRRSLHQRLLDVRVEKLLEYLDPEDKLLLVERYWQRLEWKEMAELRRNRRGRGPSYQAIQQRTKSAERRFAEVLIEHGEAVAEVAEEEL